MIKILMTQKTLEEKLVELYTELKTKEKLINKLKNG